MHSIAADGLCSCRNTGQQCRAGTKAVVQTVLEMQTLVPSTCGPVGLEQLRTILIIGASQYIRRHFTPSVLRQLRRSVHRSTRWQPNGWPNRASGGPHIPASHASAAAWPPQPVSPASVAGCSWSVPMPAWRACRGKLVLERRKVCGWCPVLGQSPRAVPAAGRHFVRHNVGRQRMHS